jgi:hypothetical protein
MAVLNTSTVQTLRPLTFHWKVRSCEFWQSLAKSVAKTLVAAAIIAPATDTIANETATWRMTLALTTAAVYLTNA